MKVKCPKLKLVWAEYSANTPREIWLEHPYFAAQNLELLDSIPAIPNSRERAIAFLASLKLLNAEYDILHWLSSPEEFANIANPTVCNRVKFFAGFVKNKNIEFPRFRFHGIENPQNILSWLSDIQATIDEYRERLYHYNLPESVQKRKARLESSFTFAWSSEHKFSFGQAKTLVSLIPYFWNKGRQDGKLFALWVKILMTPQSALTRNPWKFRASDILDMIEEFESIVIKDSNKTMALRHLRAMFKIAQESQKINLAGTDVAQDDQEFLLDKLTESKLIEQDTELHRKGVTLSDGTFLALPRMADFANRISYFKAMQDYRLRIKQDRIEQAAKNNALKPEKRKLGTRIKLSALDVDDF